MICARCFTPIKSGQLYILKWRPAVCVVWTGPRHVACPTPREIAHRKRMGRL